MIERKSVFGTVTNGPCTGLTGYLGRYVLSASRVFRRGAAFYFPPRAVLSAGACNDCGPDVRSPRERGSGVTGELLIRV